MNRTTRGVLAAGAGVALLVGGGGTLAWWNDAETVPGGLSIDSGVLTLGAPDCGAGWVLDAGTATEEPYVAQLLVPGDTLTKTCTIDLTASGEHLEATLALDAPTWDVSSDGALTGELAASSSFVVNGVSTATVTEADALPAVTDEIEATVSVVFTGATATNASQGLGALLDDLGFTATQAHP